MRIVNPEAPSPLLSLIADVEGALAYAHGETADPSSVGLTADGLDVEVRLVRPATDFVSIVASPTFAVLPPGSRGPERPVRPASSVAGPTSSRRRRRSSTLVANDHYWAGPPPIKTVELVHDIAGRSPVSAFEDGDLDMTGVFPFDATWIAYDETLGPQLRRVNPFRSATTDSTRLGRRSTTSGCGVRSQRRSTGAALVGARRASRRQPSRPSMVRRGSPAGADKDFLPVHDAAAARQLLAEAGYPGGAGFPETTMLTFGGPYDAAVVAEIKQELGVPLTYETDGGDYFTRLAADPPQIWSMGWIADYPGPTTSSGSSSAAGRRITTADGLGAVRQGDRRRPRDDGSIAIGRRSTGLRTKSSRRRAGSD